jgi:hypothetical protein
MKLNLTLGGTPKNGYLNIDPYFEAEGKTKADLGNLNEYVDDNECSQILALDILEYLPVPVADQILNHWISKLAHNGQLILSATNVRQVCKCIINKSLPLDVSNELLYGSQRYDWEVKRGMVDIERLTSALQSKGLRILSKRLNGLQMCVVAERP